MGVEGVCRFSRAVGKIDLQTKQLQGVSYVVALFYGVRRLQRPKGGGPKANPKPLPLFSDELTAPHLGH